MKYPTEKQIILFVLLVARAASYWCVLIMVLMAVAMATDQMHPFLFAIGEIVFLAGTIYFSGVAEEARRDLNLRYPTSKK